tara:strand:- start:2458 stop:3054 length:597 start_codon:yes stop_codon:yes gene_type:complete
MIKTVNIKEVKTNPDNPRFIKDHKFKKLVQSLKDFPEMLEKRPMVVDENMVVLGGNMRLKACTAAGFDKVHIIIAKNWSEEQKRQFIIKDNVSYGEWDYDILANVWDNQNLIAWGLDLPKWDNDIEFEVGNNNEEDYEYPDEINDSHVKMVQLFLTTETEPQLRRMELELRSFLKTDNLTDSIFQALKKIHNDYTASN